MPIRDVLVSGACVAGPTLACWLLRAGFTPTRVERAPALRTGGYIIDVWEVGHDGAERRGAGFDARVFESASHGRFTSLLRGDTARRSRESIEGEVETLLEDGVTALAMAGAYVLAHGLATAGGAHAASGERERRFRPPVDGKQRTAARVGGWFAPRTRLGIRLRDLTTSLLRLPPVADRVVRRSLGHPLVLPSRASRRGTSERPSGRDAA